jgi:hypothetical protein
MAAVNDQAMHLRISAELMHRLDLYRRTLQQSAISRQKAIRLMLDGNLPKENVVPIKRKGKVEGASI